MACASHETPCAYSCDSIAAPFLVCCVGRHARPVDGIHVSGYWVVLVANGITHVGDVSLAMQPVDFTLPTSPHVKPSDA